MPYVFVTVSLHLMCYMARVALRSFQASHRNECGELEMVGDLGADLIITLTGQATDACNITKHLVLDGIV